MNPRVRNLQLFSAILALTMLPLFVTADDLRHVKHGETVPACKLPALDGSVLDSEVINKGSVIVYVCLSAEQRRSELAANESSQVVKALAGEPVRLVHVTADAIKKAYYEKFRQEHQITAPLAFDADRVFYSKLGIIAFPTTIIINPEGKLDNVISLHGTNYKDLLDAHIRHALGKLSDAELQQHLAARPADTTSPKSAASVHRSLARVMREKGQLDAAKDELNKGIELDPENAELALDLAELDLMTGKLDAADPLLATVMKAHPEHRRAKQLRGVYFLRSGKLAEAQAMLQEALELNPSPEIVHYYLGQIFEQQGDKDKALEHYREALKGFVHDTAPGAAAAKTGATPPVK